MRVGNVVYFALSGDGLTKVGTTRHLHERMLKLGDVQLQGAVLGGRGVERQLHRELRWDRITGEWFRGRIIDSALSRIWRRAPVKLIGQLQGRYQNWPRNRFTHTLEPTYCTANRTGGQHTVTSFELGDASQVNCPWCWLRLAERW